MNYTDEQLKLALVRALPETLTTSSVDLTSHPDNPAPRMTDIHVWVTDWHPVLETEWPAIVGMVEDKLTDRQYVKWALALNQRWLDDQPKPMTSYAVRSASSQWQLRAVALVEIGELEIQSAMKTKTKLIDFTCPSCGIIDVLDARKRHWCDCNPGAQFEMQSVRHARVTDSITNRFLKTLKK